MVDIQFRKHIDQRSAETFHHKKVFFLKIASGLLYLRKYIFFQINCFPVLWQRIATYLYWRPAKAVLNFFFQFDPAIQRWYSARVTFGEYYRTTPKTSTNILLIVVPFLLVYQGFHMWKVSATIH